MNEYISEQVTFWREVITYTITYTSVCALASMVPNSMRPYGLSPTRLLCPLGFSRQEYWSGLPRPPPGDLLDPGIEPTSVTAPASAGKFFTTSTTWEPQQQQHTHTTVDPTKRTTRVQVVLHPQGCGRNSPWLFVHRWDRVLAVFPLEMALDMEILLWKMVGKGSQDQHPWEVKEAGPGTERRYAIIMQYSHNSTSLVAQLVKNPPAMRETWV